MRRTRSKSSEAGDSTGFILARLDGKLLTQAQEIELARQIRTAVILNEKGHEQFDYKNASPQAKKAFDTLATCNLRLVVSIAKKYQRHNVPLEDLIQEGNVGLLRAVAKFDPEKGYKFSTYATWWIRQSMTRYLGNNSRSIRLPIHVVERWRLLRKVRQEIEKEGGIPTIAEIAKRSELTIDQVRFCLESSQNTLSLDQTHLSPDGSETPLSDAVADDSDFAENWAIAEDRGILIQHFLDFLTKKQRDVLILRYGLDGNGHKTLKTVGETLGITRERVRQIEWQARLKIMSKAKKLGINIRDYLEESA